MDLRDRQRQAPSPTTITAGQDSVVETILVNDTPAPKAGGGPPIRRLSFLLLVLLPFIASTLYFGFLATDQYTAEARFAVRSLADDGTEEGIDSHLLSMRSASQDAYVVTSFIHSLELLDRLSERFDLKSIFNGTDVDLLSRLGNEPSREDLLEYWNDQVSTYIDGPSGIITLKVRTFAPESSLELTNAVVAESETLINELNKRAQEDMLRSIRGEVERTSRVYSDELAALTAFRRENGILSAETQAQETGTLLTGLLSEKLKLETQLFVSQTAGDSPTYQQLLKTKASIDSQIEELRNQMTGPEHASLSQALLEFSRLETNRVVAEKLYEAARRNYDTALAASLRKALYVMVFVKPSLPEEALYPKRISTPLLILLGLFVLWTTLMLVWASVEDHRL
mgnify:CR=1 FL=1